MVLSLSTMPRTWENVKNPDSFRTLYTSISEALRGSRWPGDRCGRT